MAIFTKFLVKWLSPFLLNPLNFVSRLLINSEDTNDVPKTAPDNVPKNAAAHQGVNGLLL